MESHTNRYRSRILREMHQNTNNPFNSPPSSTGSHGTVTLTSDISLGPALGSKLRANDVDQAADNTDDRAMAFNINTSVLGRTFPEWANYNRKTNVQDYTEDLQDATDYARHDETKENIIPASSSTIASPSQIINEQQTYSQSKTAGHKSKGQNVTTLLDSLKTAQQKSVEDRTFQDSLKKSTQHQDAAQKGRSFLVPELSIMNDFVSGTLRLTTQRNGMPVFVKNGKVHDKTSVRTPAKHSAIDALDVPHDEKEIFVSVDKIREEIGTLQEHDAQVSDQLQELEAENDELKAQLRSKSSKTGASLAADQAQIKQLQNENIRLQEQLDKVTRKITIIETQTQESHKVREIAEGEADAAVRDRDHALRRAAEDARRAAAAEDELASAQQAIADMQQKHARELRQLKSENEHVSTQNASLREEIQHMEKKENKLSKDFESIKVENHVLTEELVTKKYNVINKVQDNHQVKIELKKLQIEKTHLHQRNTKLEQENASLQQDNAALVAEIKLLKQQVVENEQLIKNLKKQIAALQKTNHEQEQQRQDLLEELDALHALIDDANTRTMDATAESSQFEDQRRVLEKKISTQETTIRRMKVNVANNQALLDDANQQMESRANEAKKRQAVLEAQNRKLAEENTKLQQQLNTTQAASAFPLDFSAHREVDEAVTKVREMRKNIAKRLTKEHTTERTTEKSRPAKVTRIVAPGPENTKTYTMDSITSSAGLPTQDDFTREIDLDEAPAFTTTITNTVQRASEERKKSLKEAVVVSDDEQTGEASQSLPPPFFNDETLDKDALSEWAAPTTQRSVETREENMTSAFFVDDITLDRRNKTTSKKSQKHTTTQVFSENARRVLAGLCDEHDCCNCNVCIRINSHAHEGESARQTKQTIRVDKPIAVTDRIPNRITTSVGGYEDGPTIRPSANPAHALAQVLKELKDEEQHLLAALGKLEAEYKGLDASYGRTNRKAIKAKLQRLTREVDVKRDQIYLLHDVLEGQKANGEEMTTDFVEHTIRSIFGKDETWNGIQE